MGRTNFKMPKMAKILPIWSLLLRQKLRRRWIPVKKKMTHFKAASLTVMFGQRVRRAGRPGTGCMIF
jgi:hypothetical protein